VRFVPITEIVEHDEQFDPDNFNVKTFDQELHEAEDEQRFADARREAFEGVQKAAARIAAEYRWPIVARGTPRGQQIGFPFLKGGNLRMIRNTSANPSVDQRGAQKQITNATELHLESDGYGRARSHSSSR